MNLAFGRQKPFRSTTPFPIGALLKGTETHVSSLRGNKDDNYGCPDCHKDVVFCSGPVKGKYFRHKQEENNPCTHYNHPGESEIHKEGKRIMKYLLETGNVCMERRCPTCAINYFYDIPTKTENSSVKIEEKIEDFDNGGKQADVMYIINNKRHSIFEIYNTHLTHPDNRPEPWYEVDANGLPPLVEKSDDGGCTIKCIRRVECDECAKPENKRIKELRADFKEQREEYDDMVQFELELRSQISTRTRNHQRKYGLPQDDQHNYLARMNKINEELQLIENGTPYNQEKLWQGWDDSCMAIEPGVLVSPCEV